MFGNVVVRPHHRFALHRPGQKLHRDAVNLFKGAGGVGCIDRAEQRQRKRRSRVAANHVGGALERSIGRDNAVGVARTEQHESADATQHLARFRRMIAVAHGKNPAIDIPGEFFQRFVDTPRIDGRGTLAVHGTLRRAAWVSLVHGQTKFVPVGLNQSHPPAG